jgi:diguanylate cyclase (GGDEF)-like protein
VNATSAVLTALLIQQGCLAVLWLVLTRLRLARRASWQWGLGIALVSAGLCLIVLRDELPRWVGFWLSAVVAYVGMTFVRRGVEVFAKVRPPDRQHLLGALVYAAVLAATATVGPHAVYVLTSSAPLGLLMLLAGRTALRHLAIEFGRHAALACASPLFAIGGVLILRGVLSGIFPTQFGAPMHAAGHANLVAALAFVACGLLLNVSLCSLVATRLLRRLQRASEHDALTGLLNRRGIESRLLAHMRRRRRGGPGFALLSIDADHFKSINDRHGHPSGDAVLRALGQVLSAGTRPGDLAARAGGEEFWLFLPGTDATGARAMGERLLQDVRAMVVRGGAGEIRLTVSMGIALADHTAEDLASLMTRLDRALYRAKALGRDRLEFADPPVEQTPQPAEEPSGVRTPRPFRSESTG